MLFQTVEQINAKTGDSRQVSQNFISARKTKAATNAYYSDKNNQYALQDMSRARRDMEHAERLRARGNAAGAAEIEAKAIKDLDTAYQKLDDTGKKYGNQIKDRNTDLSKHQKIIADCSEATDRMAQSQGKLRSGFAASTISMAKNIGATMAIGTAIDLTMKGFDTLDKHFLLTANAQKTAMKDVVSEYKASTDTYTENINTINSLSDEFTTLSKGVDAHGKNISLTAEQYARYNEIVSQLVATSPQLVKEYTAEGNAVVDRNKAIQEAIDLQESYRRSAVAKYTSDDSMRAIRLGSAAERREIQADMQSAATELDKLMGEGTGQRRTTSAFGLTKAGASTEIKAVKEINDVLGENVDLENASAATLLRIAERRDEIIGKVEKSTQYTDKEKQSIKDSLSTISTLAPDLEATYQSTIDALQTYVSSADETGVSIASSLPESMQESYAAGLKKIAMSGLGDAEMKTAAKDLVTDLQKIYSSNEGGFRDAEQNVENAKEKFLGSARDKNAVKEYNDSIKESIGTIDQLAESYRAAGNDFLADALDARSLELADFGQENILTLADAFNPLIDKITEARTVKEKFDAAMAGGDYDTTVNSYKEMYDSMMDGYNNAGNGTQGFWNFAELTLGQTALKDFGYDIDAVNARLKELAPVMEKTESGTNAFFDLLAANRDKLNEIEGVTIAEDGSWDIPAEKYGEVARQLGIAEDLLVGCVDNARHWADVKLWDSPQKAVKAIKDMDTTFESAEGKAYAFYDTVAQQAQQAGLSGQEFTEYMDEIGKKVELIDLSALDFDPNTTEGTKKINALANQLTNMSDLVGTNGKLDLTGTIAMFKQMGATADQTTHALEKFRENGNLDIGEGVDIGDTVTQAYGELEANDPFAKMTSSVDGLHNAINQLISAMGMVPEDWMNLDGINQQIKGLEAAGDKIKQSDIDAAQAEIDEKRANLEAARSSTTDTDELTKINNTIAALNQQQIALDQLRAPLEGYTNLLQHAAETGDQIGSDGQLDQTLRDIGEAAQKSGQDVDQYIGSIAKNRQEADKLRQAYHQLESQTAVTDATSSVANGAKQAVDSAKTAVQGLMSGFGRTEADVDVNVDDSEVDDAEEKVDDLDGKDVDVNVEASARGLDSTLKQIDGLSDEDRKTVVDAYVKVHQEGEDPQVLQDAINALPDNKQTIVGVTVNDASASLEAVQSGLDNVEATTPSPTIAATDNATSVINSVLGALAAANGRTATTTITTRHVTSYETTGTPPSKYAGTPNRRVPSLYSGSDNRRRAGSAAKGGKLGPHGKGGLTLTGELGPELVWLPDEDTSFLTGVRGPEMRVLPGNAVVWPYEETKRIFGGTVSAGYLNTRNAWSKKQLNNYLGGSSARGANYQFGSAKKGSKKKKSWSDYSDRIDFNYDIEKISEETYYKQLVKKYKKVKKKLTGSERRNARKAIHDAYAQMLDAKVENLDFAQDMDNIDAAQYYTKLAALASKYKRKSKRDGKYTKEYRDYQLKLKEAADAIYEREKSQIDFMLNLGVNKSGTKTYNAVDAYKDLQNYLRKAISGKVTSNTSTKTLTSASYAKKFLYTGTSNRRQPIRSMARGSGRIGPAGRGGLTLTGELGPELVWLPDDNLSFVVGLYGPEMVDLPSNAVVWPNDETQAIFGDTVNSSYLEPTDALTYEELEYLESLLSGSVANGANLFGSLSTGKRKKTTTKTTKTTKRPAKSTKKPKKKKKKTKKKKTKKKNKAKTGIISSIKTSSKLISGVNKGKSSSSKSNTDNTWNAMSEEERQQLLEDLKEARQDAYDYQNDTFERILNNSFSDDWNALNKYLVDAQKNLKTLNELQDSDKIIEARQQIVDTFFDNLNEKFDDVKEKISDNDLFNSWGDGESALTLLMQYKAQLETIYAANKDALGKDTDAAKQYLKLIKEVNRELVNAKAEAKDKYDDIFQLVEQLVRQEKKDLIDALEKQKDKYDDIIAKKKESLQLTENELDYQDQLSDYAKQEAKLRTQIASLSRDTSREAKAKRAELQEQLDQLLVEKNRTVRQETISRTNDALDKQQESYGDFIDKLTESINAVLDNQEAVNALVYDALDNRDTNNLLQRLYDYNAEYGDGLIQTVEEWQMDLNDIVENEIYKELKYQTEALRASLINEVGYGDDEHKGKFTDDVTSWNNETISRFLYSFDQLSDKYFDEAKLLDTIIEKYEELIKKFDALWFGDSSGQVDATSKIRMANAYKAQVESAEATVQTAAGQADDALIAANTAKAQAEAAKSEADAKKAEADVANANLDAAKQKVANAQKQLQSDKAAYSNAEKNVVNANKALDSALNARDKAASKVAKMQNALETAKAKSYKSKEARSKAIAKAKDNLAAAKSAYTTANKNVTTANDNVKKQHQNLVEIDKKIGNDIKSIESAQAAAAIAEKEAAAATQVWESFLAAQREAEVNAKLAMYQYDAMAQNLANATQELEIARERFESANTALLNAMDNDVIVPSYNILSDAAQSLDGVLSTFANTNLVSDEIMAGIASLGASVNTTNQANNSPQTYSFNMPFTVTVNGNMSQADQAKLQSDLSNAVYNGLYNALQMNGLATSTSANALKN